MTTRSPSRSSRIIAASAVAAAVSFAAHPIGAQTTHSLSPLARAQQVMFMPEDQVRDSSGDVRQSPLSPEDQALAKRWAELFAAIIIEFRADHRDMIGNIEGDFTTGEIRVRRATGTDDWASRTLTRRELATADLPAVAKRLYAESKRPA